MPKHGKKYEAAAAQVEADKLYTSEEAVALLKKIKYSNFDETIEVHLRLGIDPRQADQAVRSSVVLPHGTGKIVRVLVFAAGEAERAVPSTCFIAPSTSTAFRSRILSSAISRT